MSENEQEATGGIPPERVDHFLEVIQSLNGTMINIKRYPAGSSIVQMAMERGLKSFTALFQDLSSFTFSENERSLLIDNHMMGAKVQQKAFVESFIQQMHERNIRSITFHRGLNNEELVAFLNVLSEPPEKIKEIEDISVYLPKMNITHIDIDKKVFVAIGKDQAVANKSVLENLVDSRGGNLSSEEVNDGMFISFLLSKIPLRDFNLKEEDLERIKQSINYDRLKDAKQIDYDSIGPVFTAALEKVLQVEEFESEQAEPGYPSSGSGESSGTAPGGPIDADVRKRQSLEARERDDRVDKLVSTFKTISRTIVSFQNPQVRAKLLADFIKVVTNFKSVTLAKILTAKIETPQEIDLKSTILASLNLKKRSRIVDLILWRIARLVDGLAPNDFKIDPDELDESEVTLIRLMGLLQTREEKAKLGERTQRALGMARLIKKEGKDDESLLILKMRRLIVKPPEFFLEEEFLDYFGELIKRLTEARRQDIIKRLFDRIAENLGSEQKEVRIRGVNAFIKIQQELYLHNLFNIVGDNFTILFRGMSKETDPQVFAIMLASIVSGFQKLLENGKFNIATNTIKSLERLRQTVTEPDRKEILSEGISRITHNQQTIEALLEAMVSEDESVSDASVKVLLALPGSAALPQLLRLLKSSEEMRVRKKCTNVISKFGDTIVAPILQELNREQPWYYIRNLVNLLASTPKEEIVQTVARHVNHQEERVRKACVATLMKVGSKNAQQLLIDILRDQEDSVAKSIVNYFGQIRAKIAAPVLMDMIADKTMVENKAELTAEVIFALGRIGDPESVDVLIALVRRGGIFGLFQKRDDEILLAVLKAFALMNDPKAASLAGKYVRDKNPEIARAAKIASQSIR